MTNEFLRGLNLDEEIIQKIQAENGKDINAAKQKLQTQIDTLTGNVSDLQGQLSERESAISEIQQQLTEAQGSKTKMNELQQSLTDLQNKYNTEMSSWQSKMEKQQYEFLAKETINGIKFSSNAARDNFYQKLIEKNLPVENQKLLGFDDYIASIKQEDPGAFVTEEPPKQDPPPAHFVNPQSDGSTPPPSADKSVFGFNFAGIRKHD